MANTPSLVRYGAKGGVFVAIAGVSPASPTDATGVGSGGPTSFSDVGLISEDGVSLSKSVDTTDLKGWGAGIIRTSVTDTSYEFSFSMLETNADVLALYMGADPTVVATTKFEIQVPGQASVSEFRMAVDWQETTAGTTKSFRLFLPRASITGFEDITLNTDEAVQYGVTVKALSDTSGKAYYVWGLAADIGSALIGAGFEND